MYQVPSPDELLTAAGLTFDPSWTYRLALPTSVAQATADGFEHLLDFSGPLGEPFVLLGHP
jgi:hypothetical protein